MTSWNLLRRLKDESEGSWLVMGDFNEILENHEMCGKRNRNSSQMLRFKEALWDCGVRNLKLSNSQFTFSNRRKGIEETKTRIDRAIANVKWHLKWPGSALLSCFANASDHKPILVSLEKPGSKRAAGHVNFRFEPMWLREGTFKEALTEA